MWENPCAISFALSLSLGGCRFTRYAYRFTDLASNSTSATGTARTAGGSPAEVRLGVASCASLWSAATFQAYAHLAEADVDLVLHLGLRAPADPARGWSSPRKVCSLGTGQGMALGVSLFS